MKFPLLTLLAMGTTFHQALASPVASDSAPARRQAVVNLWQIECSPGTVPDGGDPNVFCRQHGVSCTVDGELQYTPETTEESIEGVCFEICYCRLNLDVDPPVKRL
ncbi:hypothetical protein QBC41DRAFT_40941 [Cercophora samala]|uniref:Uncharacterized protein n=1 Tax=Cercophora samala TaxID=330535 RepID=A0AA40D2E4_9PEZI|nr:hypothetical protein QBC41DRAFT_40941 [Cercophora samala]